MTLHVHMIHAPDSPYKEHLHGRLDASIQMTYGEEPPDPAAYRLIVGGRPKENLLDASPHLEGIVIPFAGLPNVTRERVLDGYHHLKVYNLHHNAIATAEMAIALLTSAARYIVPVDRAFRQGDWTARYEPVSTRILSGKTALILGYGTIGAHIGRVCEAMGMQVLGIKRRPPFGDTVFPTDRLHELLPRADVLVICLPLTDETRGLIGPEEIAMLPESIVINVGRGAIVHEQALFEALRDGKLHSAGLDVWYEYPKDDEARTNTFPANFPFHELDNVVMSPHRAGDANEGEIEIARMDALADLLNTAARGEPIANVVDVRAGY